MLYSRHVQVSTDLLDAVYGFGVHTAEDPNYLMMQLKEAAEQGDA